MLKMNHDFISSNECQTSKNYASVNKCHRHPSNKKKKLDTRKINVN